MPRYRHLRIACKNHVKQQNKAQIEERVPSDTSPFTAIVVSMPLQILGFEGKFEEPCEDVLTRALSQRQSRDLRLKKRSPMPCRAAEPPVSGPWPKQEGADGAGPVKRRLLLCLNCRAQARSKSGHAERMWSLTAR